MVNRVLRGRDVRYEGPPRSRRNSLSTRPVWERRVRRATCAGEPLATMPPAAVTAFGTEVDDVVRFRDDIQVVLDDHYRVAGADQAVQDFDELCDVGHVQADGRLIEQVERVAVGHSRARRAAGRLAGRSSGLDA